MSQLSDDHPQNYRLFIDAILDAGRVWGLCATDSWLVCDSDTFESTDVMPLWGNEEDAAALCSEEWSDYTPTPIALAEFVDQWLTELATDSVLIGPNWNSDLQGLEIEPAELAQALLGRSTEPG